MRVSLAPVRKAAPLGGETIAAALLDPAGARIVLGQQTGGSLVTPIAPAPDTLFGPRGAALLGPGGPLVVCDTGHHRLLVWMKPPSRDASPADLVIGQPDFHSEGRNACGACGPATLNVPTGIALTDDVLAVADAWNHRILIWHGLPQSSNEPADVVLGQADFASGLPNRGTGTAAADTLNWCYGVAIAGRTLIVADTGNRRVLLWHRIPERNGTPADLVLGQSDFSTRDENAGHEPDASTMRWPHGIAVADGRLCISDAGNNRIMVWNGMPARSGTPCAFMLGQRDASCVDHNQAAYYPTAVSLNMPYGLAVLGTRLVAADTANSRLLGYDLDALAMNAPASRLAGQPGFVDKGDNRWTGAARDSLCWPYSVSASGSAMGSASGGTLLVADSGNNRVLLWEAAP